MLDGTLDAEPADVIVQSANKIFQANFFMVERQAISRLNREFVILKQANTPQFTASPSESDMLTWHYVIHDLPKDSPYYGGQYHGKLVFPREYPLKPPSIWTLRDK